MTSDADVENAGEQQFLFHCSCGATIETNRKMSMCGDCGETVEVIRCTPTSSGKKYTLRISKHRRDWNTEPLLSACGNASTYPVWPHNFRGTSETYPARRHHQVPDYNERFARLGLLILLSPLWIPLLLMLVSLVFGPPSARQDRSNTHTIEEPKPDDCGVFSGCHYEKHTRQEKGYTIITWERVDD